MQAVGIFPGDLIDAAVKHRRRIFNALVPIALVLYLLLDGATSRVAIWGYFLVLVLGWLPYDPLQRYYRKPQHARFGDGLESSRHWYERRFSRTQTAAKWFTLVNYAIGMVAFWGAVIALVAFTMFALVTGVVIVVGCCVVSIAASFDYVWDGQVNYGSYIDRVLSLGIVQHFRELIS